MKTTSKILIYYTEEEKDLEMMADQAIKSSTEENVNSYFQHLAFN